MEKYYINIVHGKKTIEMEVRGSFTEEDVQRFARDYQNAVSSITTDEYTLEVDCTNMEILRQEMIPQLEGSMQMYKESGFKTVQFNTKSNAILKLQIHRLARNIGLKNSKVVDV
ncbi:hypothetical protein SAMN05421676_101392 [Salinibacillus kushneri]|uniref:STAS domain-containing protein n=1 Tax=Salinibacillus kushneri TaxID=237682 RepID=A0A1H9Z6G1_9BACI|nr:hypothetical protein [Salinibacillus kushneri]SES76451.1 hypothetical protein SAMN05421676_101392 [Salinibacillus kushneri]